MSRRYEDPVEVRPVEGPVRADQHAPGSFLWQGRLYVVLSVLGHWCERRSWWTAPAARAVHGESQAGAGPGSVPGAVTAIDPVPPASISASARRAVLGEEREVWRVEASRGRSFGTGVYDLCRDPGSGPVPAESPGRTCSPAGSWRLLRVAD